MKRRIIWLGIVLAAMIGPASQATAQFDCFSFSSDLAQYNDISSDGTSIYTTVAIDGSQQMNVWGQCQQFYGYAVHTAYVFNQLSTSEQTVGGSASGDGVCASCYISAASEEYITPLPSEQVQFENAVSAGCNFGGTFFSTVLSFFDIELAYTKSKWNNQYSNLLGGSVQCYVTQWCSVASQPPACNPSYVIQDPLIFGQQASCWPYYNTKWVAERIGGSGPWTCIPLIPGQNAVGTSDSNVIDCTKQ